MGEDDGHLQEISLAIDFAYLGIILLGYLALFGNQEKERIFYFYNIRKAFTWAFCVASRAMSHYYCRAWKSLSTLFVLISCFFIAVCSMIINDRNRVEAGFQNDGL